MWELDCEESWVPQNWCFWTEVLEKTLESPLDCKEIQPVHSDGDQPWGFFGRNDAKAETPVLWPPHAKSWLIGKDPDAGRDWGQEEKGTTEDEMAAWHHWLDGHESEWTPGVGDGQGGLACCDSWGRKESDTTEGLNWTELLELLLNPDIHIPHYLFHIFPICLRVTSALSFPNLVSRFVFLFRLLHLNQWHLHESTSTIRKLCSLLVITIINIFNFTSKMYFTIVHFSQSPSTSYFCHLHPGLCKYLLCHLSSSMYSCLPPSHFHIIAKIISKFNGIHYWKFFSNPLSHIGYDPDLKQSQQSLT